MAYIQVIKLWLYPSALTAALHKGLRMQSNTDRKYSYQFYLYPSCLKGKTPSSSSPICQKMKSGSYIKLTDKDANVAVCKKTFPCSQPPKIPANYLVPLTGPNIDFGYLKYLVRPPPPPRWIDFVLVIGRWLKDKQNTILKLCWKYQLVLCSVTLTLSDTNCPEIIYPRMTFY